MDGATFGKTKTNQTAYLLEQPAWHGGGGFMTWACFEARPVIDFNVPRQGGMD